MVALITPLTTLNVVDVAYQIACRAHIHHTAHNTLSLALIRTVMAVSGVMGLLPQVVRSSLALPDPSLTQDLNAAVITLLACGTLWRSSCR